MLSNGTWVQPSQRGSIEWQWPMVSPSYRHTHCTHNIHLCCRQPGAFLYQNIMSLCSTYGIFFSILLYLIAKLLLLIVTLGNTVVVYWLLSSWAGVRVGPWIVGYQGYPWPMCLPLLWQFIFPYNIHTPPSLSYSHLTFTPPLSSHNNRENRKVNIDHQVANCLSEVINTYWTFS